MEPSASSFHHPYPLILSVTTESFLFISRVFPGVDIMERKAASLQRVLVVICCVYTEQQPWDYQVSFPLSILGSSRSPEQTSNNIHDLLCSRYDHLVMFQSLPLSEEVSVIGPILQKQK